MKGNRMQGSAQFLSFSMIAGMMAIVSTAAQAGAIEKNFDDAANGRIVARANTMVTCDSPKFRPAPATGVGGSAAGVAGNVMLSPAALAMSQQAGNAVGDAPCVAKEIPLISSRKQIALPAAESGLGVTVKQSHAWEMSAEDRLYAAQHCPENMNHRDLCVRRRAGYDQDGNKVSVGLGWN